MADAKGVVTELDGSYALVRIDEAGCGRCHEDGGCGGHNIGRFLCRAPQVYRALNSENAVIGDHVKVTVPDGVVKRSALFAYVFPLLALFAGAFVGKAIGDDIGSVVGAVAGLLGVLVAARLFGQRGKGAFPYIRR